MEPITEFVLYISSLMDLSFQGKTPYKSRTIFSRKKVKSNIGFFMLTCFNIPKLAADSQFLNVSWDGLSNPLFLTL